MTKQLFISPERCIGCRTCELICSKEHFGAFDPARAAISVVRDYINPASIPLMCFQCDDPRCVRVCPTNALWIKEPGRVEYDANKCIGCRVCMMACPFGNLRFSPDAQRIVKCDLCGEDPQCVSHCHAQAIQFLDVQEIGVLKQNELGRAFNELGRNFVLDEKGR